MDKPIFTYSPLMIFLVGINIWLGFDLRGIVAGNPSEAERLMHRLGIESLGQLLSPGGYHFGYIHQDADLCNDCRMCLIVCPKDVYQINDSGRVRINQQWECFACNACVIQCREDALFLGE